MPCSEVSLKASTMPTRARPEGGDEIIEQGVGLCDLVIHVHQDRNVEGIVGNRGSCGLPRLIVTFCNPEIAQPPAQPP